MDEPARPDAPAPAPTAGDATAREPGPEPGPEPLSPEWRRRASWMLAALVLLCLAFGGWGLWRLLSPASDDIRSQLAASEAQRDRQQRELDDLRQQVATLARSDQISRDANRDVQSTLAERDEEIAGLRADVAFYERLVGATGQRRGLSVHAIRMQPQNDTAWHFTSTLTQNLNRGAVSIGQLSLAIEGTRDGRRQTLDWDALRQGGSAPGLDYSFKYFQQVEGDVFLPEGFTPVRVTVRLKPRSGAAVEQSFTWADATRDIATANSADTKADEATAR